MKTPEPNKYKLNTWIDTTNMKKIYGIDCKIDGKWYHMCGLDTPDGFSFKTKKEANDIIKEMKKEE